jgi:ribosomal protein L10
LSLNLEGKKEVVAEVSARLADAQTVILAEYRGLPWKPSPCCAPVRARTASTFAC